MTTRKSRTTSNSPSALRRRLLRWYAANGRHELPWRQTRDRYAILVSEVMLQQTQVSRVEPRWRRWMGLWPDVQALARASQADVVREWSGLGYNNRAVRLWRAANAVVERCDGEVPATPGELRILPGVGQYTAEAVASFGGTAAVIPVDVNIGRVLARAMHGIEAASAVSTAALQASAAEWTTRTSYRDTALALMDLGAMVCLPRKPGCEVCPLRAGCLWLQAGMPSREWTARPSVRFEETARYARGRIIAALGEGPASLAELEQLLPADHRPKLGGYIAALTRDGLIEASDSTLRLVGDAG